MFCSINHASWCQLTLELRRAQRWDILDLALWLIRRSSPELSLLVSRYLLADLRSLQAAYIIPNHLAQADPLIKRFERWAREHLRKGFSLQEAAKVLATSPRTLQRRCDAVLGKSLLAYFQDLRVEHAQSLLHGNDVDIEEIAAEVGYADGATLRRCCANGWGAVCVTFERSYADESVGQA
jgi:transcriptional regulator GlxA family with amidase domain